METPFSSSEFKALLVVSLAVLSTFAAYYAVSGHSASSATHNTNLEATFAQWKADFNQTYGSSESTLRFQIFSQSYKMINEHNANESASYKLGLTKFAAMTLEEFSATYFGYNKKPTLKATKPFTPPTFVVSAIEWDAITPPKDQGQCGSCWAFSSTGALETLTARLGDNVTSLSEQQLIDCSSSYQNQGCNGGSMDQAFEYVMAEGITTEEEYPYKGVDGKCKNDTKPFLNIDGYFNVQPNNVSALQDAVYDSPVSVAIAASSEVFQHYKSGILDSTACGDELDHGVLIVGYDNPAGFWKIKNSWGGSWGENGFVRVAIQEGEGVCGVQSVGFYPYIKA